MARADDLKALVASHAAGDDARFYSVALQVAARAARGGQGKMAQELRDAIDEARSKSEVHTGPRPVPVTQPRGDLAGLLSVAYPDLRLTDLVLDKSVANGLERVVVEHRQRDKLAARGFRSVRKLLFIGPPGTGKTMSAGALAGELRLPLFTIRLDGVITKFMGETAAKLRLVFDAMVTTPGIYFFDEVDALAGERSRGNDVGEIRRVLNSFLQFLEHEDSASLLLAATNHPQLLDQAMFRRFDSVIEYGLPASAEVRRVIRTRLTRVKTQKLDWPRIGAAAEGLSQAELTLATERAAKDSILDGTEVVTTARLIGALRERGARSSVTSEQ
jgi:SpoVK/Ycf46/Vps4 family AAA+-type ATPase